MRLRSALLGAASVFSLSAIGVPTEAAVLTNSYASWAANAGTGQVNTQVTGQYTPFNPLATVSTVNLPLGAIGLSDPGTVVVRGPSDTFGTFDFNLSNGFTGDLFLPSGTSITLRPPSDISALGFYVATESNDVIPTPPAGGYVITVTLSTGQSQTFSTLGGDFGTGLTPAGFFGYYGGAVSSLTITDTDPNGFVFGDFYSVPEPASASLLLIGGISALVRNRRRTA